MSSWLKPLSELPLPVNTIADGVTFRFKTETRKRCMDYARSNRGTTNYENRNQDDLDKREFDDYTGKLGECGFYNLCLAIGIHVSLPDFNHYPIGEKSYKPDFHLIEHPNIKIHVKTMAKSQMEIFGLSWMLQAKDSLKSRYGTDYEILKRSPEHFVALVMADDPEATVVGVFRCSRLETEVPLRDPVLAKLIGIKKVIQNEHVQKLTPETRWEFRTEYGKKGV